MATRRRSVLARMIKRENTILRLCSRNILILVLFVSLASGQSEWDESSRISSNGFISNDGLALTVSSPRMRDGSVQGISTESEVKPDPIKVLFENNREIRAAEKAYQASLEKVKTSGVLPDPMVESSIFIEPIQTRNGPMEAQLMFGQKFPLWGKLRHEKKITVERAEIARLNLQHKKVMAVFQMRRDWENYLKIKNSLDILDGYRKELETFRTIALTQYSTGTGITQHPILKLQIEISLIESQINSLQSSLESTVNSLRALFGGSFSPEVFNTRRTEMPPSKPPESWLDLASRAHPSYLRVQRERQIAILENELAVRKNYPDLVAGFTYTAIGDEELAMAPAPGADALGFKIGLNIPLWFGRNKARAKSTKLIVMSREENIEEVWNQIEGAVQSTKKDLDEVEKTYILYEERLIQESEQMLSSAFAAYETGKISFLDLLDSERMVVRVRLEFETIKAQRRIAGARLLRDVGIINWDEE
ncbi:MAG: TolC family protein [Fidelibacterota bacterium]|nr:MAG: TolC family protein [Candidatus Neomarinimicrobiota bacterium]